MSYKILAEFKTSEKSIQLIADEEQRDTYLIFTRFGDDPDKDDTDTYYSKILAFREFEVRVGNTLFALRMNNIFNN